MYFKIYSVEIEKLLKEKLNNENDKKIYFEVFKFGEKLKIEINGLDVDLESLNKKISELILLKAKLLWLEDIKVWLSSRNYKGESSGWFT